MNIGLLNGTAAAEAAAQTGRISAEGSPGQSAHVAGSGAYAEDTTSLTSASDSVQNLTQTAMATDPARDARVQSLKQAVNQGSYSIEPGQIASALSSAEI